MWKKVKNYENYEVSDKGEVRNIKTSRILKSCINKVNGYAKVRLSKNNIVKTLTVHRLILESFIGNCPFGMIACHNNGIKIDNNLKNLRWDTYKSNSLDAIKHGVIKTKLTKKQVEEIRNKYIPYSKKYNS